MIYIFLLVHLYLSTYVLPRRRKVVSDTTKPSAGEQVGIASHTSSQRCAPGYTAKDDGCYIQPFLSTQRKVNKCVLSLKSCAPYDSNQCGAGYVSKCFGSCWKKTCHCFCEPDVIRGTNLNPQRHFWCDSNTRNYISSTEADSQQLHRCTPSTAENGGGICLAYPGDGFPCGDEEGEIMSTGGEDFDGYSAFSTSLVYVVIFAYLVI